METGRQSLQTLKRQVTLCELLDRVLNKGAVLTGNLTISVADIDLIYLGINLLVSSVETIRGHEGTHGIA